MIKKIKENLFIIEFILAGIVIFQFAKEIDLTAKSQKAMTLEHLCNELEYIEKEVDNRDKETNKEKRDVYFKNFLDSYNRIGYGIEMGIYEIETVKKIFYGRLDLWQNYVAYSNDIMDFRTKPEYTEIFFTDTNFGREFENAAKLIKDSR